MAALSIVYWRDIPAQVIVKAGRQTAKRQLPDRFQIAIDTAAMISKAAGTDDYLAAWRRSEAIACGDDLDAEAASTAQRIAADYDDNRLTSLAANGGREGP